jgi:hypothetical protein
MKVASEPNAGSQDWNEPPPSALTKQRLRLHPVTGERFRWHGGQPGEITRQDLPYITRAAAAAFLEEAKTLPVRKFGFEASPRGGERARTKGDADATNHEKRCPPEADIKHVKATLKVIPNDDVHYDDWIRLGWPHGPPLAGAAWHGSRCFSQSEDAEHAR